METVAALLSLQERMNKIFDQAIKEVLRARIEIRELEEKLAKKQ